MKFFKFHTSLSALIVAAVVLWTVPDAQAIPTLLVSSGDNDSVRAMT